MAPEVARFWDARVDAEPPPVAGAVREGDDWTIEIGGLDGLLEISRNEGCEVIINTASKGALPLLFIHDVAREEDFHRFIAKSDAETMSRKAFMGRMRKLSPLEGRW
jgi:hypothetical protein